MNGMLVIGAKPDKGGMDDGDCNNQVMVPKEALMIDTALPKEGEEVEFMAAGKVIRIEGENYVVEVTRANDQDVMSGAKEETMESPDDEAAEKKEAMDSIMQGGPSDE